MFRSLLVFVFLFSIFIASSASAQDSPDALNARASRLIDSTMASLNVRAERFNEELAKINAVKPLDIAAKGKDSIPQVREKVKDFLAYLDLYRSLCDHQKKDVEDSALALRGKMPSRYKETFLKDFLEAYDLDQSAFIKYTQALTKLFSNMDVVLAFIETSNVTIKDKKLQFTGKADYDKYTELMAAIEKSNKKLINASAASQKATIDASSLMQKAYGEVNK